MILAGCAHQGELRGTADLGVVIERASGKVAVVNTSSRSVLGEVDGLGDLSCPRNVFPRRTLRLRLRPRRRLTKVDLLTRKITRRVIQAGNSIGGSISQDGRLVVAQNYEPGGIKAFDAETLELVSEIPAEYAPGKFSRVVGLADVPGKKFVYALFDAGEIWVSDFQSTQAKHRALPGRQATVRRPRDSRWSLLPGGVVRRGRGCAAGLVAGKQRRAPHP